MAARRRQDFGFVTLLATALPQIELVICAVGQGSTAGGSRNPKKVVDISYAAASAAKSEWMDFVPSYAPPPQRQQLAMARFWQYVVSLPMPAR